MVLGEFGFNVLVLEVEVLLNFKFGRVLLVVRIFREEKVV